MEISFVLVEPAVPENIGAAARAIKTMGFQELRLVNPGPHLSNEARWLAHGSHDILQNAKVFRDLGEAIDQLDFTIATTAKRRSAKFDYYTPEDSKALITSKKQIIRNVGIVFGREESGLTNEELALCDIASSIPLPQPYPSLNLAQCVMLYAYVFSDIAENPTGNKESAAQQQLFKEMKRNSLDILQKLRIDQQPNLHNRIMERLATANEDDVRLFLSFAKYFNQLFDKK